jgi:hypothetical protein
VVETAQEQLSEVNSTWRGLPVHLQKKPFIHTRLSAMPTLKDGDLIVARMMGAYTAATATEFNFFKKAEISVLNKNV